MTRHSFSVGEHVIYSEQGLSGVASAWEYEVRGLLVREGESISLHVPINRIIVLSASTRLGLCPQPR
jgi:hypothetical protein